MLDSLLHPYVKPSLDKIASKAHDHKVPAALVTLTAFGVGLIGCFFVAIQSYLFGLIFIVASRVLGGLDGMLARKQTVNGFGSYLKVVCEYALYLAFVFFFIIAMPPFQLAGAFLMMAFGVLGISLVAGYWGAQMSFEDAGAEPSKVIIESSEIFLFMGAACLFPTAFPALAFLFGLLCVATAVQRSLRAWHQSGLADVPGEPIEQYAPNMGTNEEGDDFTTPPSHSPF